MLKHWAAYVLACALIASFSERLAAQAPAPADDASKWGPYARLAGQTLKDVNPAGFRLQIRWQTPGEVLLEEWYGSSAESDKPAYVMTIRLGPQPGTLNLKSSSMLGKEWVGTLQDDGSVSFVGKGLLKMRYTVRLDEQGAYEQADTRGHTYRYLPLSNSTAPVVVAQRPRRRTASRRPRRAPPQRLRRPMS